MSIITRAFALLGSGELDSLNAPISLILGTLARYPTRRSLETEHELEAFLLDDERIRIGLVRVIEVLAALDLTGTDEPGAADLKDDCMSGADAWLNDLRRFVSVHPRFKEELASQARLAASANLEALAAAPLADPGGGGGGAPPEPPPSGAASCALCNADATTELGGFALCDSCLREAMKHADRLMRGKA